MRKYIAVAVEAAMTWERDAVELADGSIGSQWIEYTVSATVSPGAVRTWDDPGWPAEAEELAVASIDEFEEYDEAGTRIVRCLESLDATELAELTDAVTAQLDDLDADAAREACLAAADDYWSDVA